MKKTVLVAGLLSAVALSAVACTKKEAVEEVVSEVPAITSETLVEASETLVEASEVVEEVKEEVAAAGADFTDEFASTIEANEGKAYGFAELGGVHVLLIANSTFDNGDGTKASDDAYVYVNGDNGVVLCGQLTSGGTAYPISVKGDAFVTGNRAGIVLNTIGEDNALVEAEGTDADYEEAVAVAFIE